MSEIFYPWKMGITEAWRWNCALYIRKDNLLQDRLRKIRQRLALSLEHCIPSLLPLIFYSRILFQDFVNFSLVSSIISSLFINWFWIHYNEAVISSIINGGKHFLWLLHPSSIHLISVFHFSVIMHLIDVSATNQQHLTQFIEQTLISLGKSRFRI